jgi:hypothetical protein
MIVCCNAEGFDVPGTGFSTNARDEVSELVASYPGCAEPHDFTDLGNVGITPPDEQHVGIDPNYSSTSVPSWLTTLDDLTPAQKQAAVLWAQSVGTSSGTSYTLTVDDKTTITVDEEADVDFDADIERKRRARQLDLLG